MRGALVTSALLSSVMFGVTTTATAEVVRFDNPPGEGHFIWYGGTGTAPIGLEITSDAASQTGGFGAPGQFHQAPNHYGNAGFVSSAGDANGAMQVGGPYESFLLSTASSEFVPSGFAWGSYAFSVYDTGEMIYTELPEDTPLYLGVRFDLCSGWQYGWIGVVRPGLELDAFAWGYETEPGVPIEAGAGLGTPCPGDLSGDGSVVDFDDLLTLFGMWGPCPAPPAACPGDLSGDGSVVNFDDLLALFAEWGECP